MLVRHAKSSGITPASPTTRLAALCVLEFAAGLAVRPRGDGGRLGA